MQALDALISLCTSCPFFVDKPKDSHNSYVTVGPDPLEFEAHGLLSVAGGLQARALGPAVTR
eukprot:10838585-Lingulodinium_polyedra.AAC.1